MIIKIFNYNEDTMKFIDITWSPQDIFENIKVGTLKLARLSILKYVCKLLKGRVQVPYLLNLG